MSDSDVSNQPHPRRVPSQRHKQLLFRALSIIHDEDRQHIAGTHPKQAAVDALLEPSLSSSDSHSRATRSSTRPLPLPSDPVPTRRAGPPSLPPPSSRPPFVFFILILFSKKTPHYSTTLLLPKKVVVG